MKKRLLCWFVLLTLLSLSGRTSAQGTPVGAIIGIVFGILGVCLSFALPIGIWLCVFCGIIAVSKKHNQRPVNSFVVRPGGNPPPPAPGSYPTQAQPSFGSTPVAYPTQPAYPAQQPTDLPYPTQQPPTNPAFPDSQPSAPSYPASSLYPDAPPPYAYPPDTKQPF